MPVSMAAIWVLLASLTVAGPAFACPHGEALVAGQLSSSESTNGSGSGCSVFGPSDVFEGVALGKERKEGLGTELQPSLDADGL